MPLAQARPSALLVDDDGAYRDSFVAYADAAGLDGVSAHDGLRALALLYAGLRPAVVVTDLDVSYLDGIALVRHIRASEALRSTPVIVCTDAPRPADDGDADLWLEKANPAVLVAAMRHLASSG
jgi:CheY-like chemotaxis protein